MKFPAEMMKLADTSLEASRRKFNFSVLEDHYYTALARILDARAEARRMGRLR
jgi:non-homologous end joining protein Ku